jgi:RimJ/RimL family protein N-acetyltransferase
VQLYTRVSDGRLLHYSWMIPRQARSASEWGQPIDLEPESAVLFDDYTHPLARGRGLHAASLRQRARDAVERFGAAWVYISVLAENLPSRRNIERAGFSLCASFFRTARFGRVRFS